MSPFLWVIFSYFLGSLPFGFLISRLSGKNVLEIGWRKTSGSNVFKNVGKWQGALTGILDVSKGFLAVYGAQRLGFSSEIQIFSGAAAVSGHNWSVFLRFAGGRGIGTFIGAFFAISPKILGFSLIPLISIALIWNASIGTLLFLATAIFLSFYWSQFGTAGYFTLMSLAPILIKRLSPLKEIPRDRNPLILFRNRLLLDNDGTLFDLRIKIIWRPIRNIFSNGVKKAKSNPSKVTKIIKPLATPLLIPSKIGWRAAKFGVNRAHKSLCASVKVAKKPIQKLMTLFPEKVVEEIKIEDFKKMMLSASKKIVLHQEEINKINVWPVADKDTGYNLAATLLGIEGVISQREYISFLELTRDIKEASMINARGNAGMIFTGYLIRVLDQIKNLETVNSWNLARAMRKGTKAAYHSIVNPTEGTILDVMKAAGEKSYEIVKTKKEKNIIKILEESQKISQKALAETKGKLEVLKQYDVVDAGALGFVKILEAWLESLKGTTLLSEPTPESSLFVPEGKKLEERYEVISSFKKKKELSSLNSLKKELKNELSSLGSSFELIELEDKIKFHIHTNLPEKVREGLAGFEILEWKVEDMASQIRKIIKKKPLGLVVGESADLPREFLEKNQIIEIPFVTRFPDGEILKKENLFSKLSQAIRTGRPLPASAAPAFGDFLVGYQRSLEQFEEILVITLSSKLSGAYSSARIARSMLERKQRVTAFDCYTAEVGEGLVAYKAQELISQGKSKQEILEILKNFCPKIKLIGGLKDFNYLAGSGKIRLSKTITLYGRAHRAIAKIISFFSKTGIWFLFGVEKGKLRFFGIRFGKDLAKILTLEIEKEQKGKDLKAAIAYGDNLKEALKFKNELEKKEKIKILFLSQVSSAVGAYTGPEVLIVGISPV